ncbi:sporulation/spore germination protein [Anabaena sp. UHCC 0451]|uniref:sporulation/spore germination protein n=1 Tax=Anabaena sp. UHCC 0451 TaxID=2055235 RepID=UPI002B21624E|nr:sporulation/spore germination protein [Anabaena sp. UHCC 0451]MEA5577443.1 sporulation/spore germination protein [Anabaena sp. UHCC 0451]
MNTKIRYILPLMVLAACASISSCNSSDTFDNTTSAPTPNSTVTPNPQNSPVTSEPFSTQPSPTATSKAVSGKTTQVTLYTSDDQCQDYISKQASVSADESMNEAVGQIIETRDTSDFSLSGYRINVNNGVATIDMRIAPDSKRQIASLSSCEQFALFGSLRKTLTSNAQWKIKDVRFTEKGEEIVF